MSIDMLAGLGIGFALGALIGVLVVASMFTSDDDPINR